MPSPNFEPEHTRRDTALLLAPQAVAWQFSFVLYGVYLGLLVKNVRGPLWKKFAKEVKCVNWIVLFLVTVYNGLAFADNVFWTITLSRDPLTIYIGWSVDFLMPFSAALCGLVCQVFLAVRASVLINRRLLRRVYLVGMILLALTSFAGASLVVITAFLIAENKIQGFSIGYNHSVAIWLCTSALVDIMISITLYITLRQRSGIIKAVDGLLQRLIFVALQTAAYTAVPALIGAVVSLIYPDSSVYSLLHFAFWMILPSCYGISIFTTVSTRDMIDNYIAASNPFHIDNDDDDDQHHHHLHKGKEDDVDERRVPRPLGPSSSMVVVGGGAPGSSLSKPQSPLATSAPPPRRHPLAEIAPWAYQQIRRRTSLRSGPIGVGGGGGSSSSSLPLPDPSSSTTKTRPPRLVDPFDRRRRSGPTASQWRNFPHASPHDHDYDHDHDHERGEEEEEDDDEEKRVGGGVQLRGRIPVVELNDDEDDCQCSVAIAAVDCNSSKGQEDELRVLERLPPPSQPTLIDLEGGGRGGGAKVLLTRRQQQQQQQQQRQQVAEQIREREREREEAQLREDNRRAVWW